MIEDMAGKDSLERNQFEVLRDCEFHGNDEIAGSSHTARFLDERLHRERKTHVLGHDEGEQKPPERRNHQRPCITFQAWILGFRRSMFRQHLEIRKVRDGNSESKLETATAKRCISWNLTQNLDTQ